LGLEVVVHDILHVNGIKVVCPGMEHLEALVLDVLSPVSFNVLTQEFECGLIGLDWVAQIVIVDHFLMVTQKGPNGLNARSALQVLTVYQLFQILLEIRGAL